jgi:threonine/homoserine/homoserine lactone efflux protein
MARRQWKKRPKRGEVPTMPKWMETVDRFTPGRSFVFGVLLSAVNPKNLALTLAAGAAIAQAGLSAADDAIAVAVFVAIGSVSVAGLVLLFLVGGRHATKPLASIKEFMEDHNAVIMMVVLLVLGAKLLGNGISGLSAA